MGDFEELLGGEAEEVGVWDCLTDTCRPTWWLGDGGCDDWTDMSCAETGWDGGDCPPGEVTLATATTFADESFGESDPTGGSAPLTE
jgi:hypothetical protein